MDRLKTKELLNTKLVLLKTRLESYILNIEESVNEGILTNFEGDLIASTYRQVINNIIRLENE